VWRAVFLLLLTGCNALLGLEPTISTDAAPVVPDAAPAVCPPIGTAPTFAQAPVEFQRPHCAHYSISTVRQTAIAYCYVSGGPDISEGLIAANDMFPVAISRDMDQDVLYAPAVSQDGDDLFAVTSRAGVKSISHFHRSGEEAFAFEAKLPLSLADATLVRDTSEPSNAPERRLLITLHRSSTESDLVELREQSDVWTEVRRETSASLGFALVIEPTLSPDGLRMIVATTLPEDGMTKLYYRDRPTLDAAFGTAVRLLPTRDALFDPVLTPDCGRLYFRDAARGAMFYVGQ